MAPPVSKHMSNLQKTFANAAAEAVTEDLRADARAVYPRYRVSREGDDLYLWAPQLRLKEREELYIYRPLADTPATKMSRDAFCREHTPPEA